MQVGCHGMTLLTPLVDDTSNLITMVYLLFHPETLSCLYRLVLVSNFDSINRTIPKYPLRLAGCLSCCPSIIYI